jgi:drug/metabolite transporter (DMT)-like permease
LIGLGPIFGLASALTWGVGDFCGGLLSRYSRVISAMLVSQAVGLTGAIVLLVVSGEPPASSPVLGWAALAGACGTVGLAAFYLALARGTMGLIAPLAALIGAGLPVGYALVLGDTVGALRLVGVVLALVAVVLISLPDAGRSPHDRRALRIGLADIPLVIIAGLGFAGFYLFLGVAQAVRGDIWGPLVTVRVVGLTLVALAAVVAVLRARGSLRRRADDVFGLSRVRARALPRSVMLSLVLLTGLGDLGGNAFFVLANSVDMLAIAVVLSSLYPAMTTALAFVLLHERLRPLQLAGISMAVVGIALISLGELPPA